MALQKSEVIFGVTTIMETRYSVVLSIWQHAGNRPRTSRVLDALSWLVDHDTFYRMTCYSRANPRTAALALSPNELNEQHALDKAAALVFKIAGAAGRTPVLVTKLK